jgi:hypothetical protein
MQNALGLKVGIYSTPWMSTYAGYIGGSAPNEAGDYREYYLPKKKRKNSHQVFGRYPNGINKGLLQLSAIQALEAGKSGQGRGNSGLFILPIGEVQILNSYTTPNYWNECGAFYKRIPAKVDAAGPPLEWQAYDVEIDLQANRKAVVTVQLNGRILHHQMEMPCADKELSIGLQDHVNILQFRNIWLVEK